MKHLDRLILKYGEKYRHMLEDALTFYDQQQVQHPDAWGKMDVDAYIKSIIERANWQSIPHADRT